jgi:hypothetical protein
MTATTALEHILEELEQAEGLAGLQIAIEALRNEMNVDHMVYHCGLLSTLSPCRLEAIRLV